MKLIVSVLGADIYKDSHDVWHTCDLNMRDNPTRELPESFRLQAAYYLAKNRALLYLQGGLADDNYPSLSSVMEEELLELGVDRDLLAIEERSTKTFSQLIELQSFLRRKMPKMVMILSNDWHIPRVRAMIEYLPQLDSLRYMKHTLMGAEEVLLKEDPKMWQDKVAKARARPEMKEIIAREKQGTKQIQNNTYNWE